MFLGRISTKGAHVHGVRAQDSQEVGELLKLRERVLRARIRHGSFEVDIEEIFKVFGGAEIRIVDHSERSITLRAALDLRQADVSEREGGENLKQNSSSFVMSENYRSFEGSIDARNNWLAGQHEKTRYIARVVLNAVRENVKAVYVGGASGGDGGGVAEVLLRHDLSGARGVVDGFARDFEAEMSERVFALREGLRMAYYAAEIFHPRPGQRH